MRRIRRRAHSRRHETVDGSKKNRGAVRRRPGSRKLAALAARASRYDFDFTTNGTEACVVSHVSWSTPP